MRQNATEYDIHAECDFSLAYLNPNDQNPRLFPPKLQRATPCYSFSNRISVRASAKRTQNFRAILL